MKIVELEPQEFEKFVTKQKMNNFLQSLPMYQRYQMIGKEAYLFGGFEDENSSKKTKSSEKKKSEPGKLVIVGLCVKMREKLGKKVYNMPRGPIWDNAAPNATVILEDFLKGVESILKIKGGMILQISPNVMRKCRVAENDEMIEEDWKEGNELTKVLERMSYKNLGEYEQIKWAYVLELDGKKEDDILMNFRYSHRRNVRLAQDKYGITVRELKDEEIPILKEITQQTGERRGFKDPEVNYYRDMKKVFGDKIRFVVAEWEGKGAREGDYDAKTGKVPVAAAMFLTYGGETIYLFSGSDRKYKRYAGPHLMQWEVIKKALAEGVKTYNFYGTHPVELPEEKGVYEFKRGFRGEIVEYVGTFAKPLDLVGKIYLSRMKYAKYREMS